MSCSNKLSMNFFLTSGPGNFYVHSREMETLQYTRDTVISLLT